MEAPDPNKSGLRPAGGNNNRRVARYRPGGSGRRGRWGSALLFVLTLLVINGAAPIARGAEKAPVAKSLSAQPAMTPESAATSARRETGGRVLSVTPLAGGQQGYRVRLLLDGGRVTTVLVGSRGGVREQG